MFQKTLNITVAEWIKIPFDAMPPLLDRKLHERLVFTNPDYELRHSRGEWIGNIPPQISCLKQKGRNYLIPRGFLDQLVDLCKRYQQAYRITDRRRFFPVAPIEFHGELKGYQQDAAEALLEKDFTTLVGGHKSGKTVTALYAIAQRRQPALILIPRLDLLDGWLTKIENFLQIPRAEVGILSGTQQSVGKYITIAHTGDIMHHWRKVWEHIGHLIVDECQRCPSKLFTHTIPSFDCKYMLGLSNSVQRKDRLSKLVYYYLGDVVYSINDKDAKEGRGIIHANVVARQTQFDFPYHYRGDYPEMVNRLSQDEARNVQIAEDVASELNDAGQSVVIMSGGAAQNEALRHELATRGVQVFTYEAPASQRSTTEGDEDEDDSEYYPDHSQDTVVPMPEGPVAVLVSPGDLGSFSRMLKASTLFLAVPVYFSKTLASAIRELSQNGSGDSRLKIYDYVDNRIGLLENYFRMRSYNYGVHPDVLLSAPQERLRSL